MLGNDIVVSLPILDMEVIDCSTDNIKRKLIIKSDKKAVNKLKQIIKEREKTTNMPNVFSVKFK